MPSDTYIRDSLYHINAEKLRKYFEIVNEYGIYIFAKSVMNRIRYETVVFMIKS